MPEPSLPRARKSVGRRPTIAAGIALLVSALAVGVVIAGGSASASGPAGTAPSTAGTELSRSASARTVTPPPTATTSAQSVAATATAPAASAVASSMPTKTTDSTAPIARRSTSATRPSPVATRQSAAAARPSGAASHHTSHAPARRSTTANPPATAAASGGNWMTELVPQIDPDGRATWVFGRNGGWGASDGHTIYIDPDVPTDKRFSVLVHEYGHVLEARVYGSLDASIAALSALTGAGSSDITANESTADCIALLQGATWVNYGCDDSLRAAASAILAGHRP